MLILIKLIQTLNQRTVGFTPANQQQESQGTTNVRSQTAIRLQAVGAIIALSLGIVGNIESARAKSFKACALSNHNRAGIQPSLALAANRQQTTKFDNSRGSIAQTTAPTPSTPPPPSNSNSGQLNNNLNLPKTGTEVQITSNQSLTLNDAIDLALRNNREVQVARLAITKSQASIREAQAAQALQVGMTSSLSNQGNPFLVGTSTPGVTTSSTDIQGKVSATYNLLNAGRDASAVRAAEEQVKFDQLDLQRVEQTTKNSVVTAYYDLQAADSSVIINQAAVKDATRSLSDAQLQEKAGVGTKFDILTAEVQLGTANQNLTNAQGQQKTARKSIAQLLSVDQNTEFTAADAVRELGNWEYSLEDSVVLAYKNRPEVKQQLANRNIAEQQQIVASAADSAQVNLFSNYTLSKSISNSTSAQDGYSLGAQLSWSFWDGGAAGARSYQQKVTQEITENRFTSQRNQIRFTIEQAYTNLGTSKKNIGTSTTALKRAEESLKLARLRFQAGVGTQTDVINAQTNLATARGNRITAIINYNRALSSLRIATITGI